MITNIMDEVTLPVLRRKQFSVSATKKVYFAPGNLQYQVSTDTCRFAARQYEIIGKDNEHISPSYSGWIDLFSSCIGDEDKDNPPADGLIHAASVIVPKNWGENGIVYQPKCRTTHGWRLLTADEWNYVFYERRGAECLFGLAKVYDTLGVILLPDSWVHMDDEENYVLDFPSELRGLRGLTFNSWKLQRLEDVETVINIYTTQWEFMEAFGAVFLPCAGYREKKCVLGVGELGLYRAAYKHSNLTTTLTTSDEILYGPKFCEHYVFSYFHGMIPYVGRAIRMVKDSDTVKNDNPYSCI